MHYYLKKSVKEIYQVKLLKLKLQNAAECCKAAQSLTSVGKALITVTHICGKAS